MHDSLRYINILTYMYLLTLVLDVETVLHITCNIHNLPVMYISCFIFVVWVPHIIRIFQF